MRRETSPRLLACVTPLVADERSAVRDLACQAIAVWVRHHPGPDSVKTFGPLLVTAMRDATSDIRRCALAATRQLAKAWSVEELRPWLPLLLLPAAEALSDASTPCKAAAELLCYRLCQVEAGLETAQAVIAAAGGGPIRAKLTDSVLRKLQRDVVDNDD